MSSTIETGPERTRLVRLVAGFLLLLAAVLAGRIALAALSDDSGPVIALGLNPSLAPDLPDDVTISWWSGNTAALDGNGRPLVRWLYAQGAVLVLPGKAGGCISLRTASLAR